MVFFASVFPQFMRVTTSPNHSLFLLMLVWIVLEFLTLMLIYLFISRVTRPSTHQGLMKVAGVVQLALAGVGVCHRSSNWWPDGWRAAVGLADRADRCLAAGASARSRASVWRVRSITTRPHRARRAPPSSRRPRSAAAGR
ncbi:hypothetical protein ACKZDW_25275 [Ralstonia syzygii subsp. celebesensis]